MRWCQEEDINVGCFPLAALSLDCSAVKRRFYPLYRVTDYLRGDAIDFVFASTCEALSMLFIKSFFNEEILFWHDQDGIQQT